MSTRVQLHNFRFSIYIDADGTVTLTDFPPESQTLWQPLIPPINGGSPAPSHLRLFQFSQPMALRPVGAAPEDLG